MPVLMWIMVFLLTTGTPLLAYTPMLYEDCAPGNDIEKTIEKPFQPISIVEVAGNFIVNITSGKRVQKVTITADENLLPLITTITEGNKLTIYPEKPFCTDIDITINIELKRFQALISSATDSVFVKGLNNTQFSLMIYGSGSVELEGSVNYLDVDIPGSGDLTAQNLHAKEAKIMVAGSGVSSVYASEKLDVNISGMADIYYFGKPKTVTKEIFGLGTLSKME